MRTLSVEVRAVETAYGLSGALAAFDAAVVEQASGGYVVKVDLSNGQTDIVAVLSAIQDYVRHRLVVPTTIDLDGRTYLMDASC